MLLVHFDNMRIRQYPVLDLAEEAFVFDESSQKQVEEKESQNAEAKEAEEIEIGTEEKEAKEEKKEAQQKNISLSLPPENLQPPHTLSINLEKIKADALEEGRIAALQKMDKENKAHQDNILRIVDKIHHELLVLGTAIENFHQELVDDSVALCLALVKKIVGSAVEHSAFKMIQDFLSHYLKTLYEESKIIVKVHSQYVQATADYLHDRESNVKFEKTLSVIGDETLKPGDCRLEFCGNSVGKDQSNIFLQLENLIKNYGNSSSCDADKKSADQIN